MSDSYLPRFARPGDRASVTIPDGRFRTAEAIAYPDTFFSTPARVSIDGHELVVVVTTVVGLDHDEAAHAAPNDQFVPDA